MSSRSGKVASKSDVSYKDTKVTSEPIYEALQRLDSGKAGEFGFTIAKKNTAKCEGVVI